MNNKNGISLVVLVAAIAIMLIVLTSAIIIGKGNIDDAKYDEYISNVSRVSNEVNLYYLENNILPTTGEIILLDSLESSFIAKVSENLDNMNDLYIVDINKLNDSTIKIGNGSIASKDVFLVASNTNNIYYLNGFKYKGKIIYTNN